VRTAGKELSHKKINKIKKNIKKSFFLKAGRNAL
jgi:hypothetical protein